MAAESLQGVDAKAEVAGFGRGSFVTDLVINPAGPHPTLFATGTVTDLLGTVNETVRFWKHLEGLPPRDVDQGDSRSYRITIHNRQAINVWS